jgi:hypothetical protein
MDDLVQWLREQYAEDEQTARRAISGQVDWEEGWGAERPEGRGQTIIVPHVGLIHEAVQAEHVARWNPARVLREIEAKRGVLRQYLDLREQVRNPVSAENRARARALQGELGDVLRLLALPYADRPGYRDEWRP